MSTQPTWLETGGALVRVDTSLDAVREALRAQAAGVAALHRLREPDVRVVVERRPPDLPDDGTVVTRNVWAHPDGQVLVRSAGGSGFSQLWSTDGGQVTVRAWWDPTVPESVARALRSRFRALRAQVLLHYPVLWWGSLRGMAPLHVSVVEIDGVAVLLAGPGGVGKSSLVARELAAGAGATCDNLASSDGRTAYGVLEPLRLPAETSGASGARAPHGRRETRWRGHVPRLVPDLVVVVKRGVGDQPTVRPVDREEAVRALVAGTYAAGELRRFWPLCATLGLATGCGPVVPSVETVARTLTDRLPCFELELGRRPGPGLSTVLGAQISQAYPQGARP